jgi:5'-3' exonuclease
MFDVILVDFSWIYNKYYYVAKVKTLGGEASAKELSLHVCDMLYQFFTLVQKSYPSSKILLVLDSPLSTTDNLKLNENYKQNRNKEEKEEVYKYFKNVVGMLSTEFNNKVNFVRAIGYEADQVIAYLAEQYQRKYKVLIFTGDKDLLQISYYKNVEISDKYEKGMFLLKTDKEIFEKFKNNKGEDFTRISTNKKDILKYRTLKGDQSDNLKSVFPRIKDAEIVDIIKNYWVDDQEEGLSTVRINSIIEDIRGDNSKLAEKLQENVNTWYTNYKIMNLYNLEGLRIKRVVKHD